MSGEMPERVGPYRLEALLGRGGMGEVYRAHDSRLGRDVAIKHLRPEMADRPRVRARVRREARALARLSHPAIVPVFDLVEGDDGDWIVMELVEGPSLAELLAEGRLELGRALRFGRQLAEGLAEAHGKGLLHRDLKAENVLIAAGDQARIVDFGLAKALFPDADEASLSAAGAILGTCHSMSPEQARGLEVDHRSDLFSLGTLLYEMLTGRSPFRRSTVPDTLASVLGRQPAPIDELDPSLPRALAELVDGLLEKAPELRPQSAAEVAARLAELAAGPVTGSSPSEPTAGTPDAGATLIDGPATRGTALSAAGEETELERPSPARAPSSAHGAPDRRRALAALGLAAIALVAIFFAVRWQGDGAAPAAPAASVPQEAALPAAGDDPRALYRQGAALLERYDRPESLERAIASFRRAAELDGASAPAYAGLSRAYWLKYWTAGQDPQWLRLALPAAERAVGLDEHLASAGVSLALVLTALGRHDEAEAELERVAAFAPGNADALRALGMLRSAQGRLDEAEAAYRRALEQTPDDAQLHDLLGQLHFRRQRYDQAEAAFRRSVELRPDSALGHRNLAGVYQLQGRLEEAAAEIQKALEIQPRATVYANLGVLLFSQGLYGEAARAFERALEMGTISHQPQSWANLADAYRWMPGREADAREAYLRAVQLIRDDLEAAPEDATLRSRLALYLAKRGDADAALGEVEEARVLPALDAPARYRLAVALELLGRRPQALEILRSALAEGFPPSEVEGDPELSALRADPTYHRMLAGLAEAGETPGG